MLSYVPYLVLLAFACLLGNLFGWRPKGVMRRQIESLADMKNERSFNADESGWDFGRFLLVFQWCVCFGLILFTCADEEFMQDLLSPDLDTLMQVGLCVIVPAVWFFGQWVLCRWWLFLFHENGKAVIMTRVYKAVYMLAAPVALALLMAEITGIFSPHNSLILLLLLFTIVQLVFILAGIRIFWNGIGTLFYIFLYFCAFKIAPILLLSAKLGWF